MRTTVDIDDGLLERAKRLALKEKQTLGAIVGEALAAYLGSRRQAGKDPSFELIVRGTPRGKFPAPSEILAAEEEDDVRALALPSPALKQNAAP
jgi:hypothetical protein